MMKTLFTTLAIMLVLVLTGIQGSIAQATVRVSWDAQNCDPCPLPGNSYFKVWCAVVDQCDTPYEIVFEDEQLVDVSATYADFQLTEFCHGASSNCYMVIASVKKLCPDGQGGFEETCSGKDPGEFKTCQQLMGGGIISLNQITLN
ncbi:MAG: hypothetical protein M0Q51_16515 [Bacteroidales bacterium]|nr:hypothetical protein [Bacteroidales bacterium]